MVDPYSSPRRNYEGSEAFVGDYRPGYEPSAPPFYRAPREPQYYPSADGPLSSSPGDGDYVHRRHEDEFPKDPRDVREPYLGHPDENETLGGYMVRKMLQPLWRGSRTVLRIDMRRSLQYDGSRIRRKDHRRGTPAGTSASFGRGDYYDDEETHASRGWLSGVHGGGGARLKLMQVWDAPQDWIGDSRQHWNINFGFGMNVELDKGQLNPKLRLKARHVALHLLPVPELELRGKWPLGNSRLAVNAKYRIPLATTLEDIWQSSGARLMISFFNPLGTGFHLTPGGLEFDEHLVRLGEHTKLRLAASVDFPRKFPLEEGESPLKLRIHRLGLKTVIMPGASV